MKKTKMKTLQDEPIMEEDLEESINLDFDKISLGEQTTKRPTPVITVA